MKERINLIPCVRDALEVMGVSTVRVVNAVNAALNDVKEVNGSREATLSDGKSTLKDSTYRVKESESFTREGKMTTPLRFDVWHGKLAAANKYATLESVGIPALFHEWLSKMKEKTEAEKVSAILTAELLAAAEAKVDKDMEEKLLLRGIGESMDLEPAPTGE